MFRVTETWLTSDEMHQMGGTHLQDSANISLDTDASLCKSSVAFLRLGPSDNAAESRPERCAWENVMGGMCGGNAVCSDDTLKSALRPFPNSSISAMTQAPMHSH